MTSERVFCGPDCGCHEADQPLRVYCDSHCKALEQPATAEELRAALEHWEEHPLYGGCSHGC